MAIDGLRFDKSYELPFLDELRRRGVDTWAQSHYPTWSRPNYVSILTGVPPRASGVRTNHHSTPVELDSLMDRARAAGLQVASATDYDVLPRLFLRPRDQSHPEELEDLDIDAMEDPFSAEAVRAPDAPLVSPFDDARYAPWPGGFPEAGAAVNGLVAELAQVCRRHFADEEAYMAQIGYPNLQTHQRLHAQLLERVGQHAEAIRAADGRPTDEFFDFLRFWLTSPIKGIDTKYAAHAHAS